ncbi:MAG: RluA family pseudouridine synthase [Defluviitaleaceae bacterium]|nr:RluA family pseudouridine synthase [Defluviitaleaceae bacterium]
MREVLIDAYTCGQRLDRFLLKYLNRAPKSLVQKMIRKRNVKLNDSKAAGNEMLQDGDVVRIFLSDAALADLTAGKPSYYSAGELDIIYEDDNILIVNKPPGVLSQPDSADVRDSIVDRAASYLREGGYEYSSDDHPMKPKPGFVGAPAVVNRLDRNTSGVVALGKTNAALAWMNRAIAENRCEKLYLTLVVGEVRESFEVRVYLRKNSHKIAVISEQTIDGAKYAATSFEPLASALGCTLLRARLETGRFHQIRASLKYAGFPVVGDTKYGEPRANVDFQRRFGVTSQLLHCESLTFTQTDGALGYLAGKRFEAPPPQVFQKVMEEFGLVELKRGR